MPDLKEAQCFLERKQYVEALKLVYREEDVLAKKIENECIDRLEDLIFYSKKAVAKEYLEQLKFYPYYSYFTDAYHRRTIHRISTVLMILSVAIGTLILILVSVL